MTYHMNLELTDVREAESNLEFVTGDVGAYRVRIRFTENGTPLDISGYTFSVRGVRSDGKVFSDAGSVEDGFGVYTFRNEFYAVPGDLAVHFALSDEHGNYITAKIVHVTVLEGVENANDATDDLSPFTVLLSRMTDRLIRAENLQDALSYDLSRCAKNGTLAKTVSELPEDPSFGVLHFVPAHAEGTLPCAVVSGKFSDFFEPFSVTESGETTYAFTEKIVPYRAYMYDFEPGSTVPHLLAYVFNTDGTPASSGAVGLNAAAGAPLSLLHGFGDPDAAVTFCICAESEPGITAVHPDNAYFWNGSGYEPVALASRVGKIDEALDAILTLDATLLGGEA